MVAWTMFCAEPSTRSFVIFGPRLHPGSHPMQAVARSDGAWWTCPAGRTAIALIGALQEVVQRLRR